MVFYYCDILRLSLGVNWGVLNDSLYQRDQKEQVRVNALFGPPGLHSLKKILYFSSEIQCIMYESTALLIPHMVDGNYLNNRLYMDMLKKCPTAVSVCVYKAYN